MEVSEYWLTACIEDRVSLYNVPPRVKRYVSELGQDADLRTTRIPGVDEYAPAHGALVAEQLFAPGHSLLAPFLHGMPLGPLARVQVYSTDAFNRYMGKAHAAARCQHSERVHRDDDLLVLEDWIPVAREYADREWYDHPLCSKCGGFSVRRLTADQGQHLALAFTVDEAAQTLGWFERVERRGGAFPDPTRSHRESHREGLRELRLKLGSVATADVATTEYVADLDQRADVLERRISMRLD